jgi:AraC-like DNA-binding protein
MIMRAYQEYKKYNNNLPITAFTDKNLTFLAHWHTDVELIFVTKGAIRIGINNNVSLLQQDSFAICSSRDIHFYDSKDMDNEVIVVIFRPDLLDCAGGWPDKIYFQSSFITPDFLRKQNIPESVLKIIESNLHDIITVVNENTATHFWSNYVIKSKVYEICGLALRYLPAYTLHNKKLSSRYYDITRMNEVLNFIEINYKNKIDLESAAKVVNLSPCHFSKVFSKTVGQSFTSYINSFRILKAEELLKSTTLSILQIAIECGFDSIRTFNRVFKTVKGFPPSYIR